MNKKKWGIWCGIILLAVAVGVPCLRAVWKQYRTPVVGLYGLNEREQAAVEAAIGKAGTCVSYTDDLPLDAQLRRAKMPDLIITTEGIALEHAVAFARHPVVLDGALLSGLTSSLKESATVQDGKLLSVPLLSSHFEIDINTMHLAKVGMKTINSWDDIETFARAAKKAQHAHMLFAGGEADVLLDMLSALTEAYGGKSRYKAAVALMQERLTAAKEQQVPLQTDELAQALAKNPDAPLYPAAQILRNWLAEGILNQDSLTASHAMVQTLMSAGVVSVVFMSLRAHRDTDIQAIRPYTSIYFPSDAPATIRNFIAPVVHAVPLTKNKKTAALIATLLTEETQETLSRTSGLAPALANCRATDRQADDARYWVAATNAPLAGLSREVALTSAQKEELRVALNAIIRFGN